LPHIFVVKGDVRFSDQIAVIAGAIGREDGVIDEMSIFALVNGIEKLFDLARSGRFIMDKAKSSHRGHHPYFITKKLDSGARTGQEASRLSHQASCEVSKKHASGIVIAHS
jgi:hypothetical protein